MCVKREVSISHVGLALRVESEKLSVQILWPQRDRHAHVHMNKEITFM